MKVLRISGLVLRVLLLMVGVSHAQTVEKYYDRGVEHGAQGEFEAAEEEFKKALEVNQFYIPAKEGLKLIEDTLEKRVEDKVAIHSFKGEVYNSKGMLDEAIAEYKQDIVIDPNSAVAHNNLAVVYYSKGQYGLAIEHCDRAIELGYRVDPRTLEALKPYRK